MSILVLIALVVLLSPGRYPRGLFDLVMGLNRWVIRVAAYAGLMRDEYPPFRLDMGGDDPAGLSSTAASPANPIRWQRTGEPGAGRQGVRCVPVTVWGSGSVQPVLIPTEVTVADPIISAARRFVAGGFSPLRSVVEAVAAEAPQWGSGG